MSSMLRKIAQQADYVAESRAPVDTDGARPQSGIYEKKFNEIHDLVLKPALTLSDLPAYIDAIRHAGGVGIDDRELLLEKALSLMAKFKDSLLSTKLQEAVINLLYKDLPHPPSGYLCLPPPATPGVDHSAIKYAFRTADGSNYNPLYPTMGKAGTPYARSVPSRHCLPKDSLPDAGLVFDTLLRRNEFKPHPGGMSALFFAFADLVIHSIFKTNHRDWTINDTSSYLDLSILYGNSEAEVDSVRRKDGTGRIWNDVFADWRLLHMPPASCALLVLLSRNHNYIAEKILDINESGKYTKVYGDEAARLLQDDEIFNRARLVNCGYFMHIILGGKYYVGAILGMVRDCNDWRLDPLMTMRNLDHEFAPVGEGNVVSIEFNLLYRWHATLSEQDTKWSADLFAHFFENKDPSEISIDDFKAASRKMYPRGSVKEWTFDSLKRDANGRFSDDDLANILHNSTDYRAGSFKARGIPVAMRIIEILGIKQARSWGTCSLNEFRKFLGLKPYKTFKEWNPDPEIHTAANALYRDIDNLELYVGLQAEQAKEPGEGAGLCPGYTISRAILADAVCLTRGDRFLTADYTPSNLTSWGFQDCQYDKQDGSFGGLLTKLLLRTLPNHYPRGSAYAHFPFLVPSWLEDYWKTNNPEIVGKYTWNRPRKLPPIIPISTYGGVKQVLSDRSFLTAYDTRLFSIAKPVLTKKMGKSTWRGNDRRLSQLKIADKELVRGKDEITKILLSTPDNLSAFFSQKTRELIKEKAFRNVDGTLKFVDIVQDVTNLVPIHWISQEIAGLPLKTTTNPRGAWYEQDVYTQFSEIAEYVYLNFHPEHDWRLRESSQVHSEKIVELIKGHIDKIDTWMSFSDAKSHIAIENYNSHDFLKKVVDAAGKDCSHRELATQVFAAVVPTAALFAATIASIVDYFLDSNNIAAREEMLAKSSDKDAPSKVMPYIREALRLKPAISGLYRTSGRDVTLGPQTVKAFEVAYTSLLSANSDPAVFGPDPQVPVYNRAEDKSGIIGLEDQSLLSEKFLAITVPAILTPIFELKGLVRSPNRSGRFNSFEEKWHGNPRKQYINSRGATSQFPDSLIIQFESS